MGGYFILPPNSSGLAIGPNFAMVGPSPNYWTVVNGNYYYYNGTTFVNTGHSSGGTSFINPGAGSSFIYNINSSGQVSRYDGTSSASVIATFTQYAGTDGVNDVVADVNNNFYLLKVSSPQNLSVYNSSASLVCSYSVSGCPDGIGLSINRGNVYVLNNGFAAYRGTLQGNTVVFNSSVGLPCSIQNDLASCPVDVILAPLIRSDPDNTLPCLGGTRILTSDDLLGTNSYSWSGPGIVGSTSTQSITVNVPGIYTRTISNCVGLTDVRTFTIVQSSQSPLTFSQSALVKCADASAIILSASGLANYTWSPSSSLASNIGNSVLASPTISTTYTVSGSLNGCSGSTVVSIAASPIPNLYPSVSASSICVGASGLLTSQINSMTVTWQPGNLVGQTLSVSPLVSTIYSAQVTNTLGCSKLETTSINVFQVPVVNSLLSDNEICVGETININLSGATSYTVLPGNINGSSINVSPLANTTYTIIGANWTCTDSEIASATVHQLPQVIINSSSSIICSGETVTFTGSGADSYFWNNGSNASQITLNFLTTSTISLIGISEFGCIDSASIEQKVSECTSIQSKYYSSEISLYPNPGTGNFNLTKGNIKEDVQIVVLNSLGQIVFSSAYSECQGHVNLDQKHPGIYLITALSEGRQIYQLKYLIN